MEDILELQELEEPQEIIEIKPILCVMCFDLATFEAEKNKEPLCAYCMRINKEIMKGKIV